jgi:hypothetical protein
MEAAAPEFCHLQDYSDLARRYFLYSGRLTKYYVLTTQAS